MFRNVASQKIQQFAFDTTTGAPKTGDAANLTAYVSKDHGAVTVLGDTSATEMDATNAKGVYVFDLTQGETNADELTFTAKSSTANVSITPRFISTTPNFGTPAGASISGDIAALSTAVDVIDNFLDTEVAAIKAKTDNLPADPADASDIATAFAATDAGIAALVIPTAIQNADALLDRNMATGTDSGSPTVRTVRQALRVLRNKWSFTGAVQTITKEDDATASWTQTVTTSASAEPVTGTDPAGP